MPRQILRLCGLVCAVALLLGSLPAHATRAPASDAPALFIVQLADPPLGAREAAQPDAASAQAQLSAIEAGQSATLAAVADVMGEAPEPRFVYRRAFNGFALVLTPAQAQAVAKLPGVRSVERDYVQELHTDTGPGLIGAAQADLRPALLHAALTPDQAGLSGLSATGRAVFVYDAPTKRLSVQLFYQGLSAAPTSAAIRLGTRGHSGGIAIPLSSLAVPGNGASGGYVGAATIAAAPALGLSAAQLEAALLAQAALYVNIETAAHPQGELRGQLEPARGEGVLVGVIDSGIDFTSPSFSDPAPDGFDFTNPLGPGVYLGVCSPSDADGRFDPAFGCNDKLIGAYSFATTDESPDPQGQPSPRDNHGHGSHTASIAAGNRLASVPMGSAVIGPLSGVAPHANLIVYDVCGTEPATDPQNALRCSSAAILAAIDQALADGVDVLNYSIGGGSRNPWASPDSQSFLVATANDVFVAASAGNSGPSAATVSAPANAPWLMSVAASTHGRRFVNTLAAFSGGSAVARPSAAISGRGFSGAYGPAAVVAAEQFNNSGGQPNGRCARFAPGVALQGAIVVCRRGGEPRLAMAANALSAGAGGVVIANDAISSANLNDDIYPLPGLQVSFNDGQAIIAWASGCADCQARIGGTARVLDSSATDIMATFSARGPDRSSPDVLKPDLAAPGVDVLGAWLNLNPNGPDYQLLSGTSMAAPHITGSAALLRQLHPDWSVPELKSALMLTAVGGLRKEDGSTPATPYDRGAGRVDVGLAARAGFVLNESYARFLAANPALRGDPSALNLPSLAENECAAVCVFTRTLRSTLGVSSTWDIATSSDLPLAISASPASFTLAPGASQSVVFTATIGAQPVGATFFGAVALSERAGLAPEAGMPLAVRSARSTLPSALQLTTDDRQGGETLALRAQAISQLSRTTYGLARLIPEQGGVRQDPTGSDLGDGVAGGIYTRTLTLPAGTTRFRAELGGSAARDLDLFIVSNSDGDGVYESGELLCSSAGPTAQERCELASPDLIAGRADALPIMLLVQNLRGSRPDDPAFVDSFTLATGLLGRAEAGNFAVSGPSAVPAGQLFRLGLAWELTDARPGDVYIGVVGLGSTPATPGDRGALALTLTYAPHRVSLPLVRR